ncbi:MAG: response regulator transcription factor, partial [Solirubrobacteraceae bacterium]
MSASSQQPNRAAVTRKLRVLVVDDHDVVHWGFRVLLGEQPWVERCLAARTGDEALRLLPALRPDVALVDLFLAGESGADVCDSIRKASPHTRVLLISGAGRMSPAAARAAGASGFVSKDWDAREVARAVRRVGCGMTVFEPTSQQPAPMLSEREREVLDLIAAGSTNR